MKNDIVDLIDQRSVIVCCGSGGVGKTTVSASVGVAAAMRGRRTCVMTIDPAKRLADALSMSDVADEPTRINLDLPGELYAVMFDAKRTFDELIGRYAKDPAQADRILNNRLYKNLGTSLSGTQEYLATEKLFELHESGRFDCIIIDTPPTREALDFLDASKRLSSFIDNRIFRTLIGGATGYGKAFSFAAQAVLKAISKVAGSEIVEDSLAFFQAFSGMEEGFKERSAAVNELLRSDKTAYVLVTTPRRDAIDEALHFSERLRSSQHHIDAVVMNRVHPDYGNVPHGAAATSDGPWQELVANVADLSALREKEQRLITELANDVKQVVPCQIPIFPTDVHDLYALTGVARYLIGEQLPLGRGTDPDR